MNNDFKLDAAEAHYAALRAQVAQLKAHTADLCVVGIHSGGAWLAERLVRDLGLGEHGVINIGFHRDDYAQKGLQAQSAPSQLPWSIEGKTVLLLDDVLYTGRTVRAALNELFDYGRPAKVKLAVLVDRGERQLPFQADFCVAHIGLPPQQILALERNADLSNFTWRLEQRTTDV